MNCPRCDGPAKAETLRELGGVCEKCLLDFAVERDAPEFPDLKILGVLGEGGMGVVYKAEQTSLGRTVALKVLSPALASDPAFVGRFTREAQALAQLSHPNIVGIHASGVHDGVPYLVMEYVEGVPLRQLLAARKLDASKALDIVPQICDALAYAHSRGVVHRDVKPENILIDAQGRVKIADFGLAKIAEPDLTRLTRSNALMGTPHYMAPEQMENPGAVDHRADLFSLGVVFYEMLTGELPLGRFKAPSERADVDRRLDPVVLKSLERSPEDRWQSAAHLKAGLERPPGRPVPRNPFTTASLAALAGAAGVAAVKASSWATFLKGSGPYLALAFVLAILGIWRAPRVDGRRVGLFYPVFTICVLGVLLAAGLSAWVLERGEAAALAAVALGVLAAAACTLAIWRWSLIPAAWIVLGAGIWVLLVSPRAGWASDALGMAGAAGCVAANVLSVIGLFQLRGRRAPAERIAGWAMPILNALFLLIVLAASAPPPAPVGPYRYDFKKVEVGDFKVVDVWPAEPPAGQRFGTDREFRAAVDQAGLSLKDPGLSSTLLMPGRVILLGRDFTDAAERSAWEGRAERPLPGWSERRLLSGTAVIRVVHPPDGQAAADAISAALLLK